MQTEKWEKAAFLIHRVTIAPVLALFLCLVLWFRRRGISLSVLHLICAILFRAVLPALAYPLQKILSPFSRERPGGAAVTGSAVCALLLILAYWASLVTKRHIPAQLVGGSLIVTVMGVALFTLL